MSDKDLLKRLKEAIKTRGDSHPGEGWFTVEEWAVKWDEMSRPHAYKLLEDGVKVKIMEWCWGKNRGAKKKFYRKTEEK